jgi:hypothetical protein
MNIKRGAAVKVTGCLWMPYNECRGYITIVHQDSGTAVVQFNKKVSDIRHTYSSKWMVQLKDLTVLEGTEATEAIAAGKRQAAEDKAQYERSRPFRRFMRRM